MDEKSPGAIGRTAGGALVVLAAALSMGSQCNPTPPACTVDPDCPGATPETRSCINFCAPIWDPDGDDRDGFCALDECNETLLSRPGVWRCPDFFTCQPDPTTGDPAIGRCMATSATLLTHCDPSLRNCSSGTFCMSIASCPERSALLGQRWAPDDALGICLFPAREGELCDSNMGDTVTGCRACEWGTLCRDTTSGPRCLRPCSQLLEPRLPDPSACPCLAGMSPPACRSWFDIAPPDPMFPVGTGEPVYYCDTPCVGNANACERISCCDPAAECASAESIEGEPGLYCCRPAGASCDRDQDCCRGFAECVSGTCTPCGREGETVPPSAGCCRGYVAIEGVCRSCASSDRDQYAQNGACEGDFVQLTSAQGTDTFAVPQNGSASAGVAEMINTSGDVQQARYLLEDDHRLFLLAGDVTGSWGREPGVDPPTAWPEAGSAYPSPGGVTNGHRFVQLPASVPGAGPRSVDLTMLTDGVGTPFPPSLWRSMRVYDSGACSRFIDWQQAAHAAAAGVSARLVDLNFSSALRLSDRTLTPILSSGSGLFARGEDHDQVDIFFDYTATEGAAGCTTLPGDPTRVLINIGLRLREAPALVPSRVTGLSDRAFLLPDPVPCRVANLDRIPPVVVECEETCIARGDEYVCQQHIRTSTTDFSATMTYPRPGVFPTDEVFDITPEIVFVHGGVVDCGFAFVSPIMRGQIAGRIEGAFPKLLAELRGELEFRALESGVAWEDLVDCVDTDAAGQQFGNDGICSERSRLFGGRRHRCQGYTDSRVPTGDPAAATQYRCSILSAEIRRVNIRPDGIEIVLADDSSDPQYPLVSMHRAGDCQLDRDGALVAGDPVTVGTMASMQGLTGLSSLEATICNSWTASTLSNGAIGGCIGLCGGDELGVPCDHAYRRVFDPNQPTGERGNPYLCYVFNRAHLTLPERPISQCCQASPTSSGVDVLCRVASGTGTGRLFAGSTDEFACVNLNSDVRACGRCGNRCAAGAACCQGFCADLQNDRIHCGACGERCAPGERCVSGACQP